VFKIDESIQKTQLAKLKAFKENRNQALVISSLDEIRAAATENHNIMPLVVKAVENNCTLGEIADTLRDIFGEYK
jgi:methylmalonyl-CoA mutase N-terminal domain/subunit